ncbi:LysR family transcriptional regulator [Thioalkalicoccus limnaeus]|uniref:HTH-type transcriptional regulator MetR n=1 Tax=Thioalkalicoccus limnaeus TaxID=120681 RepID=A0ABV4BJE9_9GAMM
MFLEIKHLRTLAELCETGSLTNAAARLHLTQSALSHQIRSIERHFGLVLFERKSRPLHLTPAGVRLLALARQVLPEVARVESELMRLATGAAGRLHIALECHSCFDWLLPAIDGYRRDWPEVELDLSMRFDALPAVVEGRVDLVITSDPIADTALLFEPLFRYEVRAALHLSHPLAGRAHLEPADLRDECLITYPVAPTRLDVFSRFLTPAGIMPAGVRTTELSLMILELIKSGRGVAALPNWVMASAVDNKQIATAALGRDGVWTTLFAARRAETQGFPYLDDFIETARRTALRSLAGIRPAD